MKKIISFILLSTITFWSLWISNTYAINTINHSFKKGISLEDFEIFLKKNTQDFSKKDISEAAEIIFEYWDITWWVEIDLSLPEKEITKHIKIEIKEMLWDIIENESKINKSSDLIESLQENVLSNKIHIVKITSQNSKKDKVPEVDSTNNSEVKSSSVSDSWIPYKGTSLVNQTQTYQTFYFDDVDLFLADTTYEHETQIYNTNYANFQGSWSSNLPRAYKDTSFLDTIDIFTIWSADALQLQAEKQYYTYMKLTPWSQNTATIRIKWQKWYRNPFFCYSTWCIFASATSWTLMYWVNGIWWVSWVN